MIQSLGKTIRAARQFRKLTQGDIAGLLGITRGAVAQYESNTITPSIPTLRRLCEHLRIGLGDALNGVVTPLDGIGMWLHETAFDDDPEAAALFDRIAGLVEKEVLFRPSATQTLTWLARKAGIAEEVLTGQGNPLVRPSVS
jgi:transcriptional regulator with XRE-family HTH domain